jgi:outer membrane lipoprotein carrier protein
MRLPRFLAPFALMTLVSAASVTSAPSASAQAAPGAPLPSVNNAVQAVQDFYNKSQTFKAQFAQQYTVKAYNQVKSSTGNVEISKPGKMNWVYDNPQGNRVVSDGNTLWAYDATNKQVAVQNVKQSALPSALSFLTGQGNLQKDFDFQIIDGATMNFPGGYVLVGSPKSPNPTMVKMLLYVDSATSQVRRGMVIDGQGNRNRFDFLNPQVNVPVPPADFTFTAPPGTTTVNAPTQAAAAPQGGTSAGTQGAQP